MRSGWQCKTQASALTPGALNECSMLSIRPNLAAWAWDYRSVGRLLKVTVGGSGPYPTMVLVRLFNLLFILETDDPSCRSTSYLSTSLSLAWGTQLQTESGIMNGIEAMKEADSMVFVVDDDVSI